jgi:uncharacterized membrane protein
MRITTGPPHGFSLWWRAWSICSAARVYRPPDHGRSSWIGGNLLALAFGYTPIDPPPFSWLELVVSLMARCITALILTTPRRGDQLAEHTEQMTLELAILSEQKLAKIIQLLEESRRDNPLLDNAWTRLPTPWQCRPIRDRWVTPSNAVTRTSRRSVGRFLPRFHSP